jgi:formate hydrogenlyase transcriptional activator
MNPENINLYTELEERLRFETLIADLSSRFVNLPAGEVDREIMDAERCLCEVLDLDISAIWQWSAGPPGSFMLTHYYSSQDGPRPSMRLSDTDFPWFRQLMIEGRIVPVSSLEEMPAEAALDRENCRRLGVKSNLCLPLMLGGEPPVGLLGLNTTRMERDWPDALVKRLQLVAHIFTNALARKRADEALRESQERMTLASEAAALGIWGWNIARNQVWGSERWLHLFGFASGEEISFEEVIQRLHPDDRETVEREVRDALVNGRNYVDEFRVVLPDGTQRWIASRGRAYPDANGTPARMLGTAADITERKSADQALRESEARLAAGTELAGLGYYEADYAERTCFLDDRFRQVCGVPTALREGLDPVQFWSEHIHPEDRRLVQDERQKLRIGNVDRISAEYRYLHPALGQRWLHHSARVAERRAGGAEIRTFGVIRDITEAKQAEAALRQSLAEIQRLKDRLQAESDYLKAEIKVTQAHGEIIGRSPAIRQVLSQVEQVAPTDSSVLIEGETGTGKELIAQAIHRLSPRRGHVMVKVNCAALPSALVESELFGREKGAFTGALTRQIGRFEVADGSTIFLDEIGELSLEVQAKLLRVLQEGHLERLGNPRTIQVNVRVIAATHRDLVEDMRKGRFREDLYYRLNVFPIRVPPLRERTDDIPLLVWVLLEEFCSRMGKKITQVPRKTMEALQHHSWPGNVRELRNVIEHGTIVTSGDTLKVPMLENALPAARPVQTLADSEREHILTSLERTAWRIKGPRGAAALLGLNPSTLYGRMQKLGIPNRRQKDTADD